MSKTPSSQANQQNSVTFGKSVENDVDWQAETIDGLYLIRQYPKVQFFAGGRAKVTGVAYPDYVGLYNNEWVMFDSKGVKEKLVFKPDTRRRHQFEILRNFSKLNPLCFFMVYWASKKTGEAFLVTPSMQWKPKFEYGKGQAASSGDFWFRDVFLYLVKNKHDLF